MRSRCGRRGPGSGYEDRGGTRCWIVFEDEAGQSTTPPRARTWGRIAQTPVVRLRGWGSGRVSMAGMACIKGAGDPGSSMFTLLVPVDPHG